MATKTAEQLEAELKEFKEKAKALEKANSELASAKDEEINALKAHLAELEKTTNESSPAPTGKKVKYTPPLVPGFLEDDLIVILKGVPYQMKRGCEVEIPESVYKIIKRADEMKLQGVRYAREQQDLYMKAEKMLS